MKKPRLTPLVFKWFNVWNSYHGLNTKHSTNLHTCTFQKWSPVQSGLQNQTPKTKCHPITTFWKVWMQQKSIFEWSGPNYVDGSHFFVFGMLFENQNICRWNICRFLSPYCIRISTVSLNWIPPDFYNRFDNLLCVKISDDCKTDDDENDKRHLISRPDLLTVKSILLH